MPARSLSRVSVGDKLQLNPVQVDVDVRGIMQVFNGGTGLNSVGPNGQVLTVVGGEPAWATSFGGPDSFNASITDQLFS